MSSRNAGIEFTLNWASELAHHADRLYLPRVDLWRDFLPGALADAVAPLAVGESAGERFAAGELVAAYDKGLVREIGDKQFNRKFGHLVVEPRVGRFYPRGMIAGVAGIFPEEYKPFRVVGRSKDRLKVDLNHPLAAFDLELSATVVEDLEPLGRDALRRGSVGFRGQRGGRHRGHRTDECLGPLTVQLSSLRKCPLPSRN